MRGSWIIIVNTSWSFAPNSNLSRMRREPAPVIVLKYLIDPIDHNVLDKVSNVSYL